MKKLLAMTLALVLLSAALTGCGTTLEKDADGNYDRGAVITMYLADEVFDFDPQQSVNDDSKLKVLHLLFEGLTKLNSKGKWEKAMMESYTINENDRDGYSVNIELKDSKWTDGRTVQAGDFVTSWKRLVDANNKGEAASLLYDVKNARAINLGDVSVDDLGVSAVDTYTLKVTFENENVDLDRFFTNLSSIALVPLREDVLSRYGDSWSSVSNAVISNGPFAVKAVNDDGELRLERSSYYYRDTEANEYLDKYVIPYRLVTDHSMDLSEALEAYGSEGVFYLGNLPLAERANYEKQATVSDLMSTHTYYFNTTNKLFEKAEVRRALSLAIDREKVAEILTFAKAAEGIVPNGVFNTTYKTSFRKEGGKLIDSTANVDEAKNLLKSAGVTKGSFSITVRDNEADIAVAEYVAGVWGDLGFNVKVEKTGTRAESGIDPATKSVTNYTVDEYDEAYASGEFDVIAVDMTMASPDAFNMLSQFAADFSGNGIDMAADENGEYKYEYFAHVTGYNSDAYIELIEKAFVTTDAKERAALLHEAEALLLNDMPVCPIVTLQSAYVNSKLLSGFETDYYGVTDFKRVKMKNYMDYKEEETEEAGGVADVE